MLGLPSVEAQDAASLHETAKDRLIPLVKAGSFEKASELLATAHAVYERDRKTEGDFHRLAQEFYRADPELEKPLDVWIAQRPKDPFAYLARGAYRLKMGWSSRGSRWARETSAGQFRDMGIWLSQAKHDLQLVLEKMPRLVQAYCYLIEIDMNEGGHKKRSLYAQALKINPDSFNARASFLNSLLPGATTRCVRW
jgi:hypothetical protein